MSTDSPKTFSSPLGEADLSGLTSCPIEEADAAVTVILSQAEASQRNIFSTLAVTLRIASDLGKANAKSIKKRVIESELTQKYAVAETGRTLNNTSDDLARSFESVLNVTLMNKSVKATEKKR